MKLKKPISERNAEKIFWAFLIISVIINSIWIFHDKTVPKGDGLVLLTRSINIYKDLQEGNFNQAIYHLTKTNELKTDTPPAPLVLFLFLLYYLFFGLMTKAELIVNSVFLAIILWSIYKIGYHLYNKKTGLLSVIIFNAFYILQYLSKTTFLEFHISAFIALSFYFLLKTEKFTSKKYSVLLGISTGLAALTKYTFFIYLIPSLIYVFILLKKPTEKKLSNLFTSLIIFLIISGIWYIPMANTYRDNLTSRLQHEKGEIYHLQVLSLKNLSIYPGWILNKILGLLFSLLLIAAVIWKARKYKKISSEEITLYSMFFIPLLMFMLVSKVKQPAFIFPSFFPLSILMADFLINIKIKNKIKLVLILLILLYSAYNAFLPFYKNPNFFYGVKNGKLQSLNEISLLNQMSFQKDPNYEQIMLEIKKDPGTFVVWGEWTEVYFFTLEYYNLVYDVNAPFHYFYYRSGELMNQSSLTSEIIDIPHNYIANGKLEYVILVLGNDPSNYTEILQELLDNKYEKINAYNYKGSSFLSKQKMIFYKNDTPRTKVRGI